jgi:glycosyltransferase involved in cell wall biosynthesis
VKILYFADIRFPLERANGIQTMETCWAVAGRNHQVTLIVRPDTHASPRDPFDYYGLAPLDTLRLERAPVRGSAAARRASYLAFSIGRAVGRARADLLFTRDLGVASALLRLPLSMRPPLVYESHGYAPEVAGALPALVSTARRSSAAKLARLRRREARVWRSAEGYVTITRGLEAEMRRRFGERVRVAVVPDGTRLPDSRSDDTVSSEFHVRDPRSPVVGYAGHLYAWKGVDVLLEALARLPGARGLVIGGHDREPDLARVKTLAERLGITPRVIFTGLVAPPSVGGLLRTADVLALPNPASAISTQFTSPLKLFEYMAAGRPIVASDLPAIREVLRDEVTALLVAPGDPDALAKAIVRLSADPALASTLAREAAAAVTDFSWKRRAERLEALFEDVVRGAPGRGLGARGRAIRAE